MADAETRINQLETLVSAVMAEVRTMSGLTVPERKELDHLRTSVEKQDLEVLTLRGKIARLEAQIEAKPDAAGMHRIAEKAMASATEIVAEELSDLEATIKADIRNTVDDVAGTIRKSSERAQDAALSVARSSADFIRSSFLKFAA